MTESVAGARPSSYIRTLGRRIVRLLSLAAMSNDSSDNIGPPDDPLAVSTATQAVPETVMSGMPPGPDGADRQEADEQPGADSDQEMLAEPPPPAPHDTARTVAPGSIDATGDPDATWAPGQGDPLSDGEFWDEKPADPVGQPHGGQGPGPGADPEATFLPTRTCSVEDVWGHDLNGIAPGHTLKGPGEAKPLDHILDAGATDGAPPDLSAKGYELLEMLGEGGVGIVYQAVQKSVNRKIAVKMIKPAVGRDTEERDKFISEALVTGRLDHPNIVPIHDLDTTTDGQPFYTMKMVRGTPWGEVIGDKPLVENLRILLDVCDAVSFAHSRGVIHRDLKPDNVMLGEFGEVQVMDWGLGAPVSTEGELADLSRTQAAGGTPVYMAPEMVTGEDGPVGIHSDVYLLGAILYEIVTGKPPHAGTYVLETLENAYNNVIEPTECTGALLDIALKAMRTRPAERCSSANDFKQALLEYEAHAESINMCRRSSDELRQAGKDRDYELFAQALFGYREALNLWEGNPEARTGMAEAQLQYARCAFKKGDLDLAASTLDRGCDAHQGLAAKIESAQRKRDIAKRRLRLFRATAVSLTATVIVILTVASIWIQSAKRQAVAARESAVAAREAEAEQRKLAESAMTKAQDEEARAVQALTDLEKAYTDLVEAQEQEKRAWAQAEASEEVATKTRDELAKTGMLRDNSWWVFSAAAARQAQEEAAQAVGKPVELTLALSDGVELAMVLIPPGEFVMGSPPEEENRAADEHLHRVHHTEAFYLGKFELTEAQWQAATGKSLASVVDRDADPALPATGVSYEQVVQDLLPALQKYAPDGYEFRLPSEAQWEYACRAGTASPYHVRDGQDALGSVGWFLSNSNRKVQSVGGKAANAFGLHDMHGNASEICADQYDPGFYLESPIENPVLAREGNTPIVRGGSVLNLPQHCRAAYRSYVYSKNRYPFLGLRLALVPVGDASPAVERDAGGEEGVSP